MYTPLPNTAYSRLFHPCAHGSALAPPPTAEEEIARPKGSVKNMISSWGKA